MSLNTIFEFIRTENAKRNTGLRSNAYARIVDLVCEGEIEGLVNGAQSIYYNGTPLQNADGSSNFEGVRVEGRDGTNDQTYIAGTPGVESEIQVSTQIEYGAPVVRTISNADVNACRVTVSLPGLYKSQDDGDIVGSSVDLKIEVQSNGGPWVERITDTIQGKAQSKYQRSYLVTLTGSAPWNIRVSRTTEDSTSLRLQNRTDWDSYTEIIDAKLRYPNSAVVFHRLDASAFNGLPTRSYDLKLKKVSVPVNYDPVARTYSGTWSGTFKTAWTDNPAWVFYDLVTNARYGLGGYIQASAVDKWTLYTIAQYCDELVPDGFGGTEPRFTCNLYLQSQKEAFQVIRDLASCFRSMVYWASGSLTLAQDAPGDPVALYTQANVIDGAFSYSGSSAKARHTVALVTWNDPADQYRQKIEYVEDQTGIARYGIVQTDVVAIGCTSRGQANRVGRWLLLSERLEGETVSFRTSIEGAMARPGDVIKVSDASRAGARLGGRVKTATTTVVTLDAVPTLGAYSWTLYVMLPDGTVESRSVVSAAGAALTLSSALTAAPQAGAQFILSTTTAQAQTFRVVSVSEQEGGIIEVSALRHDPAKYNAVEQNLVLQPRDITFMNDAPATPSNGAVTEWLYSTLTDVRVGASFSWDQVENAAGYSVMYSVNDGVPVSQNVSTNELVLTNATAGTYTVSVQSANAWGVKSPAYTFIKSVLGKTALPADVTGLRMTVQGETGQLQWDTHPDLDVRIGGQIAVRYSEEVTGALWNTALPVGEFPGAATSGVVPLRTGTYLVKALDSSGIYSANATLVVTDAAGIAQFNAVATSTQNPTYAGTKTGLVVAAGKLQLDNATYVDSYPDFDAWENLDGVLVESGEYTFDNYIDTGATYTSRVTATFGVLSYNISNFVDGWPLIDSLGPVDEGLPLGDYMDAWVDVDAISNWDLVTQAADAKLQIYISTTNDNPALSGAQWSDYRLFYVGDYTARAFRFKVTLSRGDDSNMQVAVTRLGVTVDVPDRVESDKNISVPIGGTTVTFAKAFYVTPAIAVTASNLATGDYAEITAKSATGFTITFKNSAGTSVARSMDWIARGFGYQS